MVLLSPSIVAQEGLQSRPSPTPPLPQDLRTMPGILAIPRIAALLATPGCSCNPIEDMLNLGIASGNKSDLKRVAIARINGTVPRDACLATLPLKLATVLLTCLHFALVPTATTHHPPPRPEQTKTVRLPFRQHGDDKQILGTGFSVLENASTLQGSMLNLFRVSYPQIMQTTIQSMIVFVCLRCRHEFPMCSYPNCQ